MILSNWNPYNTNQTSVQCAYVYGTFCLDYPTRCYVSMSLLHNKVKNQVIYVIRLPIKVYLGPYWFENKVHICRHFKFLTEISYTFLYFVKNKLACEQSSIKKLLHGWLFKGNIIFSLPRNSWQMRDYHDIRKRSFMSHNLVYVPKLFTRI